MMQSATTYNTTQADHFGAMAAEWWDPKGSSAMLHRLNPVRLRFIRDQVDAHWHGDPNARTPLAGKRALDMGCGAGLLTEPLARMGGTVVGVDAAAENIDAAKAHAAQSGLTIDYRCGGVEVIAGEQFDLITSLEVIEHVTDPVGLVAGLARALAPGGLLILSTPNRTALSKLAIIKIGETVGGIPVGTHDWDQFLTPDELAAHVTAAGLTISEQRGLAFGPMKGFHVSENMKLDYFMVAHA